MNAPGQTKPILVSPSTARSLIDVGNTKFWALVKSGAIRTCRVGGRTMVVYASLEELLPEADRPAA